MVISFDERALVRHTGATFFARGKAYWKKDRVLEVNRKGESTIVGTVRGSKWKPYIVKIFLTNRGGIARSSCACPMDGGCKHVAALGLAAIDLLSDQERQVSVPGGAGRRAIRPGVIVSEQAPLVRSKGVRSKKETRPEWMTRLERLAQPESEGRTSGDGAGHPELQILFRFSNVRERGESSWQLELRPRASYPETGKVSLGKIRWAMLRYPYGTVLEELSSAQAAWFRELATTLDWSDAVGHWLAVNGSRASYFWHVLGQASSLGIGLFQGIRGDIPLAPDARLLRKVAVIGDAPSGNLSVKERVFVGEEPCESPLVVAMGNPPVCAWRVLSDEEVLSRGQADRNRRDTVPLIAIHAVGEQSADTFMRSVFSKPLTIPREDIPVFLGSYLPKLLRGREVMNESARITLPEAGRPILALTVARGKKKQSVSVVLRARYGDTDVSFPSTEETVGAGGGRMMLRDLEAERLLLGRMETLLRSVPPAWDTVSDDDTPRDRDPALKDEFELIGLEAARFFQDILPILRQEADLSCFIAENVPVFSELTAEPEIAFTVLHREGENDWFNLNILVTVGGVSAELPAVLAALADDQEFLLLENGRYFSLRQSAFQKLRTLLEEARRMGDTEKKGLSVSRFQVDFWQELSALGVVEEQSDRWEKTMRTILTAKEVALPAHPELCGATLRPYQHEGFAWLSFLREHSLGGVLGDDMGLGKTIQAIALMTAATDGADGSMPRKPFLVVAPTSVVENWDMELERFAPTIRRVVMRKGDRAAAFVAMRDAQVIVTSYALLVRDFDRYAEMAFDTLILDEAQFVKNYQSKSYLSIRKLRADTRLALTGTPMENNTMELWSIFSIVAPGLFGSPEHFRETFQNPIEKGNDAERLARLRSRIRPFLLRRKKDVVARDLPPKTEQVLTLDMHPKHQRIYDLHLQRERQRVLGLLGEEGGMRKHRFEVFKSLMKMRRLSLHAGLVDDRYRDIPSVKLDALLEQVEMLAAEGHKVLVFSQFTSFLAYARERLSAAGFDYLYLDGSTTKRGELVRRFQTDESAKVFLVSLKAGGFGLNLTAADYCFILDPWWNPAVEMQAIDRTHRIGQTKNVFVYKMITKGTIEEKVLRLQQKKRRLFKNVLENGAEFHALFTEKDVRDLFS